MIDLREISPAAKSWGTDWRTERALGLFFRRRRRRRRSRRGGDNVNAATPVTPHAGAG